MMDVLHQKHSVITFDLAIYMKAKEIQWRRPEEFKNTVIRMGGFHIALNFLSVIGKIFQDSVEDLLIESGVYGCHTASMLFKGKSYNRGVRAHKLVLEALLRLQWQAFGAWMETEEVDLPTVYQRQCLSLINCCQRELDDVAALKTSVFSATNYHNFNKFLRDSSQKLVSSLNYSTSGTCILTLFYCCCASFGLNERDHGNFI